MQRTPFAIAVFVVAIVMISFCRVHRSNCEEERQAGNWTEISLNRSLQVPRESGTTFVMQWNDACKKLIFDGHPLSHGCRPVASRPDVCIADPIQPPLDKKDQYSFDAGSFGVPADSTPSRNQDGRLRFAIEWSESRNWFAIPEPPPAPLQEVFTFNLGGFQR
jgi:hypothetical protein